MMETGVDVAVVGGGVIGCSVAWKLADRGQRTLVIDAGEPGRGATWAAGGTLAPFGETAHHPAFHGLALTSMDRWPAFADALRTRTGVDVEYRPAGKLHIAFDEEGARRLRSLLARGAGFGVQALTGDEARQLEPALAPGVLDAVLVGRDHRVDNRMLADAVWRAAEAAGAKFRLGAPVRSIRWTAGPRPRFQALVLEDGTRVEAGAAVIAAGAWSGRIEGLPHPLPIVPVRGQMFAVESPVERGPAPGGLLERVVEAPGCYIVPRASGRVLVGATTEQVGFEPGPTPAGLQSLAAAATRAVPTLRNLPITESWAGFRPGTPDGLPIMGPDPDADGIWYATGHYRNGLLLAPVTADLVATAMDGAEPRQDLDAFRPDRFRHAASEAS